MYYRTLLIIGILLTGCNVFQNEQSSERVWMFVPSAERQCITPEYSSLEEAVNQLTQNDITVLNSNELNYVVCEACTCPTGIQYNALINSADENKAVNLGWQRVDEGDDTPD